MKFNNETIRTAVEEWIEDSKKSEIKYGHISDWDVSRVTDMSYMFSSAKSFNQDIGNWNVNSVSDMSCMFELADAFNQDIGNWDVSNVANMRYMFELADAFNQDIGNWDVSNVTDMSWMFKEAHAFNQDLSKWDVRNVTNMSRMFESIKSFNQDLSKWDVSKVENMEGMFCHTKSFNQNLKNWQVNKEVYVSGIFAEAKSFKQDISNWHWLNINESKPTGFMHIAMENTTFYYGEYDENIFYAKELFIENGGSWSGADGEFEVMEKIVNELKCEDLIFTDVKNEDGEYELHRLTDLPEIIDREGNGDGGHHGPFYSDKELVDYVKKLKEISYKKLNPNNDDEVDLTYSDIFTGVRNTYHENGNIETERTFVEGVENGSAKGWFENGELEFEASKKDGYPHGKVKNYYKNGQIEIEVEFDNGVEYGVQRFYNQDGTIRKEINHDEIIRKVNWDEMRDVGIVTYYKGKPFTGIAFKEEGWSKDAYITEEVEMLNGLKHGKGVEYDENKNVIKEVTYKDDIIVNDL